MNAWTIALDSIWRHKLRSILTTLGIVIGVFAVVSLTSLGASFKTYINKQFNNIGATLITVTPAAPQTSQSGPSGHHKIGAAFGNTPSTLTIADATAISGLTADHVTGAAPVVTAAALVTRGSATAASGTVVGTTAPYFAIEHLAFASGGSGSLTSGVVIGNDVASALFGSTPAVGQSIQVAGTSYAVLGVLKKTGSVLSGDPDETVFIPVADALKLAGSTYVSEIVVGATSSSYVSSASAAVRNLMDQRHPLKDFSVITAGQILSTINSTLSVITSVLAGIAAISLVVGGIGIMNIMLVTVTERVKEIGTRKAMGARDSDILVQFLVESVLLALLGGAVGTGFSALATHVVGKIINFPVGITGNAVVVALAFSIGVGIVFGVLPAMNAARLMPAEALRSE